MKTAICAIFFKTHWSYFSLQVVELVRWTQDSLVATCTRCTFLAFAVHWFSNTKGNWNGKVCVCGGKGGEAKSKFRAEPQNSRYTRNSELVLVAELCACSPFCLPLYGTVNLVRLPPPSLSVGLKLESCSCDVWAINFQLQRSQLYCCKCNCFPSISSGLWVFLLSVFPCRNFGS